MLLKAYAGLVGLVSAIFCILAQEDVLTPIFYSVGKVLFWTGLFVGPFLGLNRDLLRSLYGIALALLLIALHGVVVFKALPLLPHLNFIEITGVLIAESVLFSLPMMLLRKQKTDIWY
jgi:hypothetical protein